MPVVQRGTARVSYSRAGRGPAVLLLQGVGLIGEGWRPQVAGLRDRFDLVTLDNRGIGGSVLGDDPLTVEAMAADALAVMDAERLDRFHLAGHSLGGLIAQQVALLAPARVRSLALLCTFTQGKEGARLTPSTLLTGVRTRLGTRRMRRQAFLELVMPAAFLNTVDRDALAARLEPLFGHDLGDQPPIVMKQLRAMSRFDPTSRLSALSSIPTLVVSAELDRIALPRYGRALAAAIAGARFVEIPDAGHGVTIHRAAEINSLLASHFSAAS